MACSRPFLRCAWLLVAAAPLTSCSGIPLKQREAAERARFEAYAGKPVDHFTWFTHYEGWEPISRNQLVVWTDINQAYLVTVFPPCTDLMFARRIGLTSTADTVYAHFDSVRAEGWHCMIDTIRPVDYRRMEHDLRQQRQAAKQARKSSS
ncbi:MAG TPA: DUF6491 family protein [Steroidobacteraceae bacterium]|jgi:hypothetical protein|nr:DUF6491 family protein [Steroidobacteraceae bacterium]